MKRLLLVAVLCLLPIYVPIAKAQQPAQSADTSTGNAAQPAATDKPAQDTMATPVGTATICFYRPHRFQGSALKPSIYVDETQIARLKNGENVRVTIPAGQHQVYSNDKSTGINLTAEAGQTYYVRIDIQTGMWKGHGGVTLVDPQEGSFESSKTKSEAVPQSTASVK